MSIFVCSGCGHVGLSDEWTFEPGPCKDLDDEETCPNCKISVGAYQVVQDNLTLVTNSANRSKALELLNKNELHS